MFYLLALALFLLAPSADAATLTISSTGPNTGNVSARPTTGFGGGICTYYDSPCSIDFPDGTVVRLMANSPNTPGIFSAGTGNAVDCQTSVCEFTINGPSSILTTFDAANAPLFRTIQIDLLGAEGEIGVDNGKCQDWELSFSACTQFYAVGSEVRLAGRAVPGSLFVNFSGGTMDAGICSAPPAPASTVCTFVLNNNSTVDATFAALTSVAVSPSTATTSIGGTPFFSATGTFDNGGTRALQSGLTSWNNRTPMSEARYSLAAGTIGDRLYAVGGIINDGDGPGVKLERYDPATGEFGGFDRWNTTPTSPPAPPPTSLPNLPTPREGLAAAVLSGELYALGGHTSDGIATAAVESYNPGTNSWTSRPPLPLARTWPGAAVIGTTLYAVGGGEQAAPTNTLEAYSSGVWTTKTAMPTARTGVAAAVVDGKLYAIGGFNGLTNVATVETYDPGTNAWETKASMPTARHLLEAVAIDGLIYAVGGTGPGPLGTVEAYNPATDTWTTLGSMPTPRSQFGLAALDGRLWAVGGQGTGGIKLASLESLRPTETSWWSDTPAVATMNANGNANALSAGTTTIIARSVGISCLSLSCATLTVTGAPPPPPPPPPDDECAQVTFRLLPGSLPFSQVQLTILEKSSGDTFGPFPVTIGETQQVPPGKYQFDFSAPAGYRVTSAQRGVNLQCGDNVTIKLRVHTGK